MTPPGTTMHAAPQSVDEVRAAMQDAMASSTPLAIRGAGTWMDAGAPLVATRTLSMSGLSGVIAYVPGDLTITAWAGTSLAELSHETAAQGQWLGLDPAGDRRGTIGATIATASAGPLAHAFGTPRDLVLGLDAVTGYGDIVRPGGRVVKNVAGFDLVRLFTGSWGTLGAITSVTLRLRALPVHDITLVLPVHGSEQLGTLLESLRQPTLSLLACEWIDATTAQQLGVGEGHDVLAIRLGGNDAFVRGQRALVERVGDCREGDTALWGALGALDRDATAVIRVSGAASTLPSRIDRLRASLRVPGAPPIAMHASVARGIVRVIVRGDPTALQQALQSTADGEPRVVEKLPHAWWASEADPFTGGLAGRIRAAFDPQQLCNRREVFNA